jgi:spore germination protein YaaH
VIPTVTDGTGKLGMQTIMGNPGVMAAHIANLVNIAVVNNYDGIDLDYEVFAFTDGSTTWAATKPLWIAFIQQLSTALHAQGKVLAVTIPPVWHAGDNKDYWVYSQSDIAASVDELRLMVYDWSPSTPSATAPIQWVKDVVAYSSGVFRTAGQPLSKLQLGVPAYGRHWRRPDVAGTPCPDGSTNTNSVTSKAAPALANSVGLDPVRDLDNGAHQGTGEMTFSWTEQVTGVHTFSTVITPTFDPPGEVAPTVQAGDGSSGAPALRLGPPPVQVSCLIRHTVFYPDAASIAGKAQIALDAGWGGAIIWAAGYESSDVYDALAALT